jgi:hypothetical protein
VMQQVVILQKKLNVPHTISSSMRNLILQCWEFHPDFRPDITEVLLLLKGESMVIGK